MDLGDLNLYLNPSTFKVEILETPVVLADRGVGYITGLQRHIFPYPHTSQVQKVSLVLSQQTDVSVHSPSLWFGHSPIGVHKMVKEVELMAQEGI